MGRGGVQAQTSTQRSSCPAAFVLLGQDRDPQVSRAALAPKSLTRAHLSGAVSQSAQ